MITSQLDKVAPIRHTSRRPSKSISRWLSKEAIAAKRERRRLERRWQSTRDEQDRINYRRACRAANKLINASRREYFRKRLLECDTQPHDKRWRVVNELLHSDATDKTRTDDENQHLCLMFADFFVSKINQLKAAISAKLTSIPHIHAFPDTPHSGSLFSNICPVTHAEVCKIIASTPLKSSFADYIPTSLVKSSPGVLSELIANLANLSFSEGLFPTSFKLAVVTPSLKKPSPDKSVPSNYRPISNFNFISKILERLFLTRLQSHILSSANFNQYQSAYRRNFSTESSLLFTTNNFFHSSDSGKSTLLKSLQLPSIQQTNPDKSNAIIIGTRQRSCSYSALASVDVAGSMIPLADHIKIWV